MTDTNRLARTAGALYLLTFATSIPALALKTPFLVGATADPTALRWAVVLELVLAVACVGTAVALLPILRRRSETLAVGFVASRTLEAAIIVTGVLAMLAIVSVGATEGSPALSALHDWAFLLGPGILPAVNAMLLAPALLLAGLVPRVIPIVGLIGAPLLLASAGATLFGVVDQVSTVAGLAAAPIALWEFTLGVWLLVRGVREPQRQVEATVGDGAGMLRG